MKGATRGLELVASDFVVFDMVFDTTSHVVQKREGGGTREKLSLITARRRIKFVFLGHASYSCFGLW
jgi:hypothetical protein